jgi:hypothetical protein
MKCSINLGKFRLASTFGVRYCVTLLRIWKYFTHRAKETAALKSMVSFPTSPLVMKGGVAI